MVHGSMPPISYQKKILLNGHAPQASSIAFFRFFFFWHFILPSVLINLCSVHNTAHSFDSVPIVQLGRARAKALWHGEKIEKIR